MGYIKDTHLCFGYCVWHLCFVVLEAKRLKTDAKMLGSLLAYPCSLFPCLYRAETKKQSGGWEGFGLTAPSLIKKKSSRVLLCYSIQMALNTTDTPHSSSGLTFLGFHFLFPNGAVRKRRLPGFSNTASLLNKHKGIAELPWLHPFKPKHYARERGGLSVLPFQEEIVWAGSTEARASHTWRWLQDPLPFSSITLQLQATSLLLAVP